MRIALNIDVALLLSQLVFFIGLSTSDNMVRKLSSTFCYSYEKCELSVNNRERSLVQISLYVRFQTTSQKLQA